LVAGVVKSLARPGGNATGLSLQRSDAAGKRIELLREVVPNLRRLAITYNGGNPLDMHEAQVATRILGLEAVTSDIRLPEDIIPAFDALKGRVEAIYVCADPLAVTNRVRINTLALEMRLPTMFASREFVEVGELMSYGANFFELYRRAAELVDKILRGAKPADLPVEQPTKFDLIFNLTTAKALRHTLLQMLPTVIGTQCEWRSGVRPRQLFVEQETSPRTGTTRFRQLYVPTTTCARRLLERA